MSAEQQYGIGGGLVGAAIGTILDQRVLSQQTQANINKPPRLEQNANRLEHLCEQLEKLLGAAHSHLDRIAGQQALERIEKTSGAYAAGPSPPAGSTLMRLEQSLDRLAALSQTLAGGVLERLSAL